MTKYEVLFKALVQIHGGAPSPIIIARDALSAVAHPTFPFDQERRNLDMVLPQPHLLNKVPVPQVQNKVPVPQAPAPAQIPIPASKSLVQESKPLEEKKDILADFAKEKTDASKTNSDPNKVG